MHLVAEQNTTITFAGFGIVSSILEKGSRGVIWLEETTRVIVYLCLHLLTEV